MSLDLSLSITGRRSLVYIQAKSDAEGVEYDLSESHVNREPLIRLWDACVSYDGIDQRYTPEMLEALCDAVLHASMVCTMMGCRHIEPEDMSEYQRLFNTTAEVLHMIDVVYTPPKGIQLTVQWEVCSDDDSVLKETPGKQLGLPFVELQEKLLASN